MVERNVRAKLISIKGDQRVPIKRRQGWRSDERGIAAVAVDSWCAVRKGDYETARIYEGWRKNRGDSVVRRIAAPSYVVHQPLLKNPVVTVQMGNEKFQARAITTSGELRQRLFDAQSKLLPVFAEYQKKTSRAIPVVIFERVN